MSVAYTVARKVIVQKKKSKAYCQNMIDVYYGAGRLSDEEYQALVALIDETYPEVTEE